MILGAGTRPARMSAKACCTVGERAGFGPCQSAQATFEERSRAIAEILRGVGVGADEGDLLQGELADIEPPFAVAQTNMHDHAAGFGKLACDCLRVPA